MVQMHNGIPFSPMKRACTIALKTQTIGKFYGTFVRDIPNLKQRLASRAMISVKLKHLFIRVILHKVVRFCKVFSENIWAHHNISYHNLFVEILHAGFSKSFRVPQITVTKTLKFSK